MAKRKKTGIKIFPVSLTLEEIKENITININTSSKPNKAQIINQAFRFDSQGNISEAAKLYQYFINQGFKDYRVFSNYGMILKNLGKLKEAELYTRKAIELNINFEMAHYNLGIILRDLGKLKEAELSYRKAIEINPNFAEVHYNLGNILKNLGKLKEAELSYRKAIKIHPNYGKAHLNLGTIFRDLGYLQDAEVSTRKAIELNPDYAMAHSNLGSILIDLGKLKDAEVYSRKAIKINPNYAEAHSNLGIILKDLGKLKELILLSKSTIDAKSLKEGYKLRALLNIAIASLLTKNFSETLFHIKKSKELIRKGALKTIEDAQNRKNTLVFYTFISSLYPILEKDNKNTGSKKIPHIGESHCLSFAHQSLSIVSQVKTIQPVLITGGKSWHFANNKNNKWKDSLTQQMKNHNYSSQVLISFGEIDCRKDEGILSYAIKNNKDISEVCEHTIKGYLDYMERVLSLNYSKRYYFGIAAPTRKKEVLDELDIKRIELIKIYNSLLKKEVLSRSSYFVDIYALTSKKDGENNTMHMCDNFHLSPRCLSTLFENHLCKPENLIQ